MKQTIEPFICLNDFEYMDNYTDYSISDEEEICGIATEGNGVFAVIDNVPVSDEDLKKYGFKE